VNTSGGLQPELLKLPQSQTRYFEESLPTVQYLLPLNKICRGLPLRNCAGALGDELSAFSCIYSLCEDVSCGWKFTRNSVEGDKWVQNHLGALLR